MENFRRLMRGWLGKVLLVLFLTPLALTGVEYYFSGGQGQYAAKVNGQNISQTELDQLFNQHRSAYLQMAQGDGSALNDQIIREQAQDQLIDQQLLLQHARKLGINFSDAQLAELVRQMPVFRDENGQFSQSRFEQLLKAQNLSVEQLLASERQQAVLTYMNNIISTTVPYSSQAQQQLLAMLGQERVAHLAEIDLNQFAQNFTATDEQAKAYYEQNQKKLAVPATLDVSFVVASAKQLAQQTQVTEEEVQAQYQSYVAANSKDAKREVSHILLTTEQRSAEQAEALIKEIQDKMKAGGNFDALAKQYSDDSVSKSKGGKIDEYNVGIFGDDFDRAVVSLSKGQISAPVKTQYGYHLIRLDQIEGQIAVKSFDEMKNQMIDLAKKAKVANQFVEAVNKANDDALQSDSLQPIAEQFKTEIQTVKGLSQKTAHAMLSQPAVRSKLFSPEIAQGDRNVSTAINLPNDEVLWFKVNQYHAEKVPSFAEAKSQVLQLMKRDEQIKQAQASIAETLKKLASQPAQTALEGSSLKFHSIGAVPRNGGVVNKAIEQAIFSVAEPKAGHWSMNTANVGDKLYVIGVSAVQLNPQFGQLTAEQTAQIVNNLDRRGDVIMNDYLAYLRSTAKIKLSEQNSTASH